MDDVQYADEVRADVALLFLSSPGLAVILLPWLLLTLSQSGDTAAGHQPLRSTPV